MSNLIERSKAHCFKSHTSTGKCLVCEQRDEIERLQARVEVLEGALLKCTMNHDEAHYIAQTALDTIAATEQENDDE